MGNLVCVKDFSKVAGAVEPLQEQILDFFRLKRKITIINKSDQEIVSVISSIVLSITDLSDVLVEDEKEILTRKETKIPPLEQMSIEIMKQDCYVSIFSMKSDGTRLVYEKNRLMHSRQDLVFEQKNLDVYEEIPVSSAETDDEGCVIM